MLKNCKNDINRVFFLEDFLDVMAKCFTAEAITIMQSIKDEFGQSQHKRWEMSEREKSHCVKQEEREMPPTARSRCRHQRPSRSVVWPSHLFP